MHQMHDPPEALRSNSLAVLQARLGDALDLAARLKQAYWSTLRGRPLFEACHDEIDDCIDSLTRQIAVLSQIAESNVRAAAFKGASGQYPLEERVPGQHEKSVRMAMARFARAVRADIDHAVRRGDANTADVLGEVSRKVDSQLGMGRLGPRFAAKMKKSGTFCQEREGYRG